MRIWCFVALISCAVSTSLESQQIAFSDAKWQLNGDSTRIEQFDGRQTLRMETGTAVRKDIVFQDGTIDVDLMTSRRRSFVYFSFRIEADGENEEFYLRPHKSGLPDAAQYAPVYQGQSAWQLYYGPRGTASPDVVPDIWQHLRIVVSGRRAAFFLNDTVRPFMVIPHLAREPKAGWIELRSLVPQGTPGTGPAVRFANLAVRPNAIAYGFANAPQPPAVAPGTIRTWEVSDAFAAPDTALSAISPELAKNFKRVQVEPDGFVELHKYLKMPADVRGYVGTVARIRVHVQQAGTRRFDIGFSDRVTVFLNRVPIFHRDDSYDFARRRDGLISFDQAAVYLPLKAGDNEITLIVTDRFGGWGVMGRFPDMAGLTVSPE